MTQRALYERLKDEAFNALMKLRNGELITRETVRPVCEKAKELYEISISGDLDYDPSFFLEEDEVADLAGQFKYFTEELLESISALTLMLVDMGLSEIEGGE